MGSNHHGLIQSPDQGNTIGHTGQVNLGDVRDVGVFD